MFIKMLDEEQDEEDEETILGPEMSDADNLNFVWIQLSYTKNGPLIQRIYIGTLLPRKWIQAVVVPCCALEGVCIASVFKVLKRIYLRCVCFHEFLWVAHVPVESTCSSN